MLTRFNPASWRVPRRCVAWASPAAAGVSYWPSRKRSPLTLGVILNGLGTSPEVTGSRVSSSLFKQISHALFPVPQTAQPVTDGEPLLVPGRGDGWPLGS